MTAILFLGFLVGVRHAFEADHLAAVASFAAGGRRGLRSSALRGAAWGLGHALTLLLVGGGCLLLGRTIPQAWTRVLELAVAGMLMWLGVAVLARTRRQRVHVHVHRHDDGSAHLHAHSHAEENPDERLRHEHPHPRRFPGRLVAVGFVHGLAGSGALVALALGASSSVALGLAYIGLFGLGSILGMTALSAVISAPLGVASRRLAVLTRALETAMGLATLAIGTRLAYTVLF